MINSPFGYADIFLSTTATTGVVENRILTSNGAQAIPVNGWETIIIPPTLTAGPAFTLNLTLNTAELRIGSKLTVIVTTTATETVTYGTGFLTGQTGITGVAGKTFVQTFIYSTTATGNLFIATAASKQVN